MCSDKEVLGKFGIKPDSASGDDDDSTDQNDSILSTLPTNDEIEVFLKQVYDGPFNGAKPLHLCQFAPVVFGFFDVGSISTLAKKVWNMLSDDDKAKIRAWATENDGKSVALAIVDAVKYCLRSLRVPASCVGVMAAMLVPEVVSWILINIASL